MYHFNFHYTSAVAAEAAAAVRCEVSAVCMSISQIGHRVCLKRDAATPWRASAISAAAAAAEAKAEAKAAAAARK